jgi:hypothetical protein
MGVVQGALFEETEKEKDMTNKETVERNIGLTFDFVNQLIEKPELADRLPDEFDVEFIEKDFPNLERQEPSSKMSGIRKKLIRVRNTFDLL